MGVLVLGASVLVVAGCGGWTGSGSPARANQTDNRAVVFAIEGMHCEACVGAITKAVQAIDGVESVEVSLADKRAVVVPVKGELAAADVVAAIEKAGYKAAPAAEAASAAPATSTAKRGVVVNITRGKDELHAVSMAIALAAKARADGRPSAVFLNVEAPVFAAKDLAADLKFADFPPVRQMLTDFLSHGGKVFVCEHCAHVVGLQDDQLIDGITLSMQAEVLAAVDDGAAVFSY
jgi:copper chaperone CopZ/predicted peroxiredoxin